MRPVRKERADEEERVQREPDRGDPERRRGRAAGGRGVPQARHQRADVLRVEEQIRSATVSDLTRMRELEAENARLKRMYADLALENTAIKDVLAKKF